MMVWFSLCLLLLAILVAGAASRGTVRLYFVAQLVATLAEYGWRHSEYYVLVYALATVLMVEMSVFLLWDAGVGAPTWREAWIAGILMTLAGGFGLTLLTLTEWYLLAEGLLFAILGMAMLLLNAKSKALLPLGTLTWAMAVYDFLYLLRPDVRAANWQAEPIMCSAAFLWLAARQMRVSSAATA
jgi:hypothetical protein